MASKHFVIFDRQLTRNKSFELQLSYFSLSSSLFEARLKWTVRTHHAGPEFRLEILGFYFGFGIYDHRHWDHDANDWAKPVAEKDAA
jgi:hypothetical protein